MDATDTNDAAAKAAAEILDALGGLNRPYWEGVDLAAIIRRHIQAVCEDCGGTGATLSESARSEMAMGHGYSPTPEDWTPRHCRQPAHLPDATQKADGGADDEPIEKLVDNFMACTAGLQRRTLTEMLFICRNELAEVRAALTAATAERDRLLRDSTYATESVRSQIALERDQRAEAYEEAAAMVEPHANIAMELLGRAAAIRAAGRA